jgi:hypothetical protein
MTDLRVRTVRGSRSPTSGKGHQRLRREQGKAVLTVLLILALAAILAVLMLQPSRASNAKATHRLDRGFTASTIDMHALLGLACQHMDLQGDERQELLTPDGAPLTVVHADVGENLKSIEVSTSSLGHAQVLQGLAELYEPAAAEEPTLTPAMRAAVLAHPDLTTIEQDVVLQDEIVEGLLLVAAGRHTVLRDCVVRGVILDESALSPNSADPASAPAVVELQGSVIFEPGSLLTGCSVIMPGSELRLAPGARLQCHGTVVVGHFDGGGRGDDRAWFHAPLRARSQANAFSSSIRELGAQGESAMTPAGLTRGEPAIARMVFDPARVADDEREAMGSFTIARWREEKAEAEAMAKAESGAPPPESEASGSPDEGGTR